MSNRRDVGPTYQRTGAREAGGNHDGKALSMQRQHNTSKAATTFTCGKLEENGECNVGRKGKKKGKGKLGGFESRDEQERWNRTAVTAGYHGDTIRDTAVNLVWGLSCCMRRFGKCVAIKGR